MSLTIQPLKSTSRTEWFDYVIAALRTHELQLETNTASEDLQNYYATIMGGNLDEMFKMQKAAAQQYFVPKILFEYLKLLDSNLPLKLAFDYNDSEVMVWAEIEDSNPVQENILARAEARINAIFHPYGFDMETMIVEKSDNLAIPNHYKIFKA
jgi:hypothetical protein